MTTRKHPRSAAATASLLSRLLRKNGFQRADTKRLRQSEGYYVYVSNSHTVAVDYHIFGLYEDGEQGKRIRRQSQIAQMRETLFELGYISSHPRSIYIECREL